MKGDNKLSKTIWRLAVFCLFVGHSFGNITRNRHHKHRHHPRPHHPRPRTVLNEYDNLYRLQSETITDDGSLSLTEYDYDDANNRTARRKDTDGDGNWDETADYDYTGGWNQLQYYTEEDANGNVLRAVNFLYDANGNRSERNAILKTYNPDNSVASTTTENDVYAWDKENRLTGVIDDIGGSSNTYTYAYDYRTRRIVRDESAGVDNQGNPGVSTSLVFSGGTSTQEWESPQLTSAQSTGAISGSARPDVTFVRGSDWGGGVGGVLYTLRADTGTTNYSAGFNFYNSRGDVIAKTDDTGTFTWQGEYQSDGTRTHEIGENKDRQRGNTKDEDPTGLLCEGFRYRDLETMTWLSKDPAGFVDGSNLYCYVNQNPWTKFDPLGLIAEDEDSVRQYQDDIDQNYDDIDKNNSTIEKNNKRIDEIKSEMRKGDLSHGGERKDLLKENMRLEAENLESARAIAASRQEIIDFYKFDSDGSGAIDGSEHDAWEHAYGSTSPAFGPEDVILGGLIKGLGRGASRSLGTTGGKVEWNNGWRTADGKFASPNGSGLAGEAAENSVWQAVKQKPGWSVIKGRVSVRDASGQLRVYDGAAISPRGRVIGLEVKSGSATKTSAQRTFDAGVNSQNPAVGVGQNQGLNIKSTIEIRR